MSKPIELESVTPTTTKVDTQSCCSKTNACPGCCDLCTSKCNSKKVIVSFVIAIIVIAIITTVITLILVGLNDVKNLSSDCGWLMSFSDKDVICVEVPPKHVTADDRRLFSSYTGLKSSKRFLKEDIHEPTAEEQSMSFTCSEDSTDLEACNAYCNADHIFLKQVFLVEDEIDNRKHWSGRHIRVVVDEELMNYNFKYALGCKNEEEYLEQDFTDTETFQCGYSEIGYDLYHNVPTSSCAADPESRCETNEIRGETYYYASMQNLQFGSDLQTVIKNVREGKEKPGIYTYAYPKSYNHIIDGCTATYKVDFLVPTKYENTTVVGG
mmetsp:Transcript_16233/g.21240  ORF Transcript_16233/g.21240 Transcript_16233/m.21240 type:complete len:325 (+) Transcript_16233:159-1133(+)|eukprot:CAMPEP_0198147930 /NCGR_PEP_ID=MMETSP1443-20131203/38607_1 /TAXON_ID=186043 /ORGANISM="Entomoneis sp., Strain CCMP2396" /LENGTH=324 /DNA_ID=CAMNT_0043812457 /DNA_START=93 /DNA_END=1067 /DNA_ORIENTATION=-